MKEFRVRLIVAGTRDWSNYEIVKDLLDSYPFPIIEIVSGGAKGSDALGERWATEKNIPIKRFSADWNTHGKSAGPIRNRQMAEYAHALAAFWDGMSRGTANMIEEARKAGLLYTIRTATACDFGGNVTPSLVRKP